jgi:hypothetical protein
MLSRTTTYLINLFKGWNVAFRQVVDGKPRQALSRELDLGELVRKILFQHGSQHHGLLTFSLHGMRLTYTLRHKRVKIFYDGMTVFNMEGGLVYDHLSGGWVPELKALAADYPHMRWSPPHRVSHFRDVPDEQVIYHPLGQPVPYEGRKRGFRQRENAGSLRD